MQNQAEFLKKLEEIKQIAQANSNRITKEEIISYLGDDNLTQEQLISVFDYLLAQKVAIKGYVKLDEVQKLPRAEYTKEEKDYLDMYVQDLKSIREISTTEKKKIYEEFCEGSEAAKSSLLQSYLRQVVEIAKNMYQGQVFLGDLIQEGNMSLVLALESPESTQMKGIPELDEYIAEEVMQGIRILMEEAREIKIHDDKIVDKINDLDESVATLKKDLGREITIEELSEYMKISEQEIVDILKLAGEDPEAEEEEE